MGLLDYYRQFDALSEEEVNRDLREKAAETRRAALAVQAPLDLSRTTWPDMPHADVVNAITFVARRGLNTYADAHAGLLRAALEERLGVPAARIVVGNGAAQLLSTAAAELLEPGDELVTPWPSYPLYPLMARRARGHAVPVPGFGVEPLLRAVNDRTRVVCVCSPNDPTGELLAADELRALLGGLPERVVVLLDEALVDFADAQPRDAALALLDEHPRLVVFRTFSKAWGLAGLRCGYAIGGPGAEPLLERLEPDVGVNDLAQAGALEALRSSAGRVADRVRAIAAERAHLVGALRERDLDVPDTQANVVWLAGRLDGAELAARLDRVGVRVAEGGPLGEPGRIRATVRDRAATDRLLRALDGALAQR